jgi:Domain of unknown function (DUF1883)
MKFLHKKFQAKKKEIVEVEMDKPARVKFMTASEFKKYTGARTHTYFGGQFEEGTVQFVLPFDSVWTVVVEKGSHGSSVNVRASVKLLPPDRNVLSTVALDAPAHVRTHAFLEESEALSEGGRNEG